MDIKTIALKPDLSRATRLSMISSAIIAMKVKIPNIVGMLVSVSETSPWHGEVRLYDTGFHAHWQDNGQGVVIMELMLTEQE